MGKTGHLRKDGANKTQYKLKLTGYLQWQTNESVNLEIQTIEKERKNNQEIEKGPGAMSEVRRHTALAKDLTSVPSTHVEWLTTTCDSREPQFLGPM